MASEHFGHAVLDYVAKLAARLFLLRRRKINSDQKPIHGDEN